jgi:hypothetical protein
VKDVDPTSSYVERTAGATETNRVFGNVYNHVECIGGETKDKSCVLPQNLLYVWQWFGDHSRRIRNNCSDLPVILNSRLNHLDQLHKFFHKEEKGVLVQSLKGNG